MKKYLLGLCLVAACSHPQKTTTTVTPVRSEPERTRTETSSHSSDRLTGASTARGAVEDFLNAVKAQDIQAMSVIFGTKNGPSRDNIERTELEKRLIILQCYFNHDKYKILDENLGEGGHRVLTVELTRGSNTRSPRFYAIAGPANRFYVDNMEIAAVRDFCRK